MLEGLLGTPRHITSNRECLIVGDHNPKTDPPYPLGGTFVYNTFPTEDGVNEDYIMNGWYRGCWDNEGNLILAGEEIRVYHETPTTEDTPPDVRITDREDSMRWISIGDYGGVAVAGDRVYVCTGNGNKILVYEDTPTGQQHPDFVIGAPSLETDTLLENNYLTNPVPASDGEHLFVSSDFDRMLYVWKNIPDTSGATPDITYRLDFAPWDNVVYDNKLIIAGADTVYVWNSLPLNGEIPDHVYYKKIGDAEFNEIRGVTMDDQYFYIADRTTNSIYIWEGLPEDTAPPKYTIPVEKPDRINSDGEYLLVATPEGQVFPQYEKIQVYKVDELTSDTQPQCVDGVMTNLPMAACTYENQLFVADTCFSRVLVWNDIEEALTGALPDIVLGEENFEDTVAETGQT